MRNITQPMKLGDNSSDVDLLYKPMQWPQGHMLLIGRTHVQDAKHAQTVQFNQQRIRQNKSYWVLLYKTVIPAGHMPYIGKRQKFGHYTIFKNPKYLKLRCNSHITEVFGDCELEKHETRV